MLNSVAVIVGLVVLATLALAVAIAKTFRKAGPNQAIIVYGFRKARVIKAGAAVIFPVVETYRELSLELMSFDVAPQQDLYTRQGVAVTVEAVAQIKVRSDEESILTAAEQSIEVRGRARRPDPTRHGRSSARHHRAAYGRADRQGARDGSRPHALDVHG